MIIQKSRYKYRLTDVSAAAVEDPRVHKTA